MTTAFLPAVTSVVAGLRLADEEPDFDPNSVTPGVIGFFAILLIAVAVVLLMIDMSRRVRRNRYRGEVREKLAAEAAEASQTAEGEASDLGSGATADAEEPETDEGSPSAR